MAFQEPFRPEFIRIRVDFLATMSQVDTAGHDVLGSSEEPVSSTRVLVTRGDVSIATGQIRNVSQQTAFRYESRNRALGSKEPGGSEPGIA
jgi:hypothetical protein